jgi:hypothetical protein
MKVKVEVDLSEFYSEDESSFSEQIKDSIAYTVKQQILADWNAKITSEFSGKIKEAVKQVKEEHIDSTMVDLIQNGEIKMHDGKKISIADYIQANLENEYLKDHQFKGTVNRIINNQSTSLIEELKNRYDMLFASQLVDRLNKQGMLKEDVAKMLLKDNSDES